MLERRIKLKEKQLSLKEIFSKGYKFNEPILRATEKGRLVFFVGAGVSRIMGVPGWDEFANSLIKAAFKDYYQQNAILTSIKDNKEKITIAFKEFERTNRLKEFYKYFGKAMKPNKKHFAQTLKRKGNIYEVLNKFQALFLTTNADNLFENVIGSPFCYNDFSNVYLADKHFRETNRLFYLHGHYDKTQEIQTDLVFTANSYIKRYNDTQYQDFLKTIFKDNENVIIFIGYGLNEFELIDYIATKTGFTNTDSNRIFILYGFCSEQDALYWAKKSYFETLGITLIPYKLDLVGYEALFDVLNELYDQYSKEVIPPIAESIEYLTTECKKDNVAGLLRYLNDSEYSKIYDNKIFKEICYHDKYKWIDALCDSGYFSEKTLIKKTDEGEWPLLELFTEWVYRDKANDHKSQEAGKIFLSAISKDQLEKIGNSSGIICNQIINIILSLDKEHINKTFIECLKNMNCGIERLYVAINPTYNFKNLFKWDLVHFEYFLIVLFDKIIITDNVDIYYDYLHDILSKLLEGARNKVDYNIVIINYFTKKIISAETEHAFNSLLNIFNLDNLNPHYGYCYLFFKIIKQGYFSLPVKRKTYYLNELLALDSPTAKKIALHLMRTDKTIIKIDYSRIDFYSVNDYYCEFFLFIKKLSEEQAIDSKMAESIAKKTAQADWGYYKHKTASEEKDEIYIDSKRLAILQLLPCDFAKKHSDEFRKKGIKVYDAIGLAQRYDLITIEDDTFYNKQEFELLDIKDWVPHVKKTIPQGNDINIMAASQEFIELLSGRNISDKKQVIQDLNQLPLYKLTSIIWCFFGKIDKFVDNTEDLIILSILVLNRTKYEKKHCSLIKSIFYLLKKTLPFCVKSSLINDIKEAIEKCLLISIDSEIYDDTKTDMLSFLINLGDYEKITLWIDCLIALKEKNARKVFEDEYTIIAKLLNEKNNDMIRYILCRYYQNLKYVFEENNLFDNLVYPNKVFDIVALELCIAGSNMIFIECVNTIITEYLTNKHRPKHNQHKNYLEEKFFSFVIFAHHFGKISDDQLLSAFEDKFFLDYYFSHLTILAQMENYNLAKQVLIAWQFSKRISNVASSMKYAKNVLFATRHIDKNSYTDEFLDVLQNAASIIKDKLDLIDLKRLIWFYDVNFDKAHDLIMTIVSKINYLDLETIDNITKYYKNNNKTREAKKLVILLTKRKIISIDKETEIKHFLNN